MIEIISSISRKEKERETTPPNSACWTRHFLLIVFLPPSIEFASAEEEFLYVFSSPLSPEVVKLMYAPPNEQLDDQEKGGKNEIVLANLFLFLFFRENGNI